MFFLKRLKRALFFPFPKPAVDFGEYTEYLQGIVVIEDREEFAAILGTHLGHDRLKSIKAAVNGLSSSEFGEMFRELMRLHYTE